MSIKAMGNIGSEKLYVSENAYNFAKSQNFEKTGKNELIMDLSSKFSNLKIGIGTQPGGQGHGNVAISPRILQKMANDPAEREKYEALLYDLNELKPITHDWFGGKIVASGTIINDDGSVSGWSIGQSGDAKEQKSATQKLLEELEKLQEKRRLEKQKEKNKDNLLDVKI